MQLTGKAELRQRLASEYVLGTLRGAARRRFETHLAHDAHLRSLVAHWQDGLAPLAEDIPSVAVPARVWSGLVRRIPALAAPHSRPGWWVNLAFWRTGAIAALSLAVLAIGLLNNPGLIPGAKQAAPAVSYAATFIEPKSGRAVAMLVIAADARAARLTVLDKDLVVADSEALELWTARAADDSMHPAGLVPAALLRPGTVVTPPDLAALRSAALLGLSLEPASGSTSPTRVLGVAQWQRVEG